jgi:hypothetical protein
VTSANPDHRILQAARTIAHGFLQGIGFSLALGLVYSLASHWTTYQASAQIESGDIGAGPQDLAKDIALSGIEEAKHDGITMIIGTVTNNGKKPAHGIHIQANLFNHGKFVDQYSTYLTGALAPGKPQYFKISCGCKDTPPAEHDSYKLEVLTGY